MRWAGLAFALAVLEVSALHVVDRRASGQQPKVVRHRIHRFDVADPVARDQSRFGKRQGGTVDLTLTNNISLYYLDVTLGTPPQQFRVAIDTGSSDLWVNSVDSDICGSGRYYESQCTGGSYDPGNSSTYEFVSRGFTIQYADNSAAQGNYVTDVLGLGEVEIQAQQFGEVLSSEIPTGIMGIGYQIGESVNTTNQLYNNVPLSLQQQGFISSLAYSLWLNDLDSSEGEILFGGINQAKYVGQLTTLPVTQINGLYQRLALTLDSVAISGSLVSQTATANVVLDSGTTYSYLPTSIVSRVYQVVNATIDQRYEVAEVDCELANYADTLDFTFGSATIRVPMNELVVRAIRSRRGSLDYGVCTFGLLPNTFAGVNLLGDTFLRSAYVVYDLENNEISLAQTQYNSTTDDIVEIANGTPVGNVDTSGASPTTATSSQNTASPTLTVPSSVTQSPTSASSNAAAPVHLSMGSVSLLGAVVALFLW